MDKITVGVDLDGVLRNFYRGVVQALEEHRPDLRRHVVDDRRDVSSNTISGMMKPSGRGKSDEVREVIFETKAIVDVFGNAPAYTEDVKEYKRALQPLRHAKAEVVVCTSQQRYAQKFATVRWLYKHGLEFDGLVLAHSNKGSYGLDWHLDDKRKNVVDVSQRSGQGVLRARPANRGRRSSVNHVAHSFEDFVELVIDSQT